MRSALGRWRRARLEREGRRTRFGTKVVVLRGGEVLLMRHHDDERWDVPAGGGWDGETPEDAARRVLREETGLSVNPLQLVCVSPYRHTFPDGNVIAWETHVFTATFTDGEARAGDDAAEVRWWPLTALPDDVSGTTRAYFDALREVAG